MKNRLIYHEVRAVVVLKNASFLACYKWHFQKMTVIKIMYTKKYELKLCAKHSFGIRN